MDDRLDANRANWDERTGVHLRSRFYDVEGWLRDERGPRPFEAEALGDVSGLRLLHLQCHFGLDTLAWARVGAEVTGLDFSSAAIDAAGGLAVRAGLDARAPHVSDTGVTYTDGDGPLEHRRMYWWNHGLGETVTAIVRHGLHLEWLAEHDWTLYAQFPWLVETEHGRWVVPPSMPRVPLTFSLLAAR